LFSTLDDFLNGRITADKAKTIALLAQQQILNQRKENTLRSIKK
jgi:hypothetical protein